MEPCGEDDPSCEQPAQEEADQSEQVPGWSSRAVVASAATATTSSVWAECAYDIRLERTLARDGQEVTGAWEHWTAWEDQYLATHRPASRADLVVRTDRPVPSRQVAAPPQDADDACPPSTALDPRTPMPHPSHPPPDQSPDRT